VISNHHQQPEKLDWTFSVRNCCLLLAQEQDTLKQSHKIRSAIHKFWD